MLARGQSQPYHLTDRMTHRHHLSIPAALCALALAAGCSTEPAPQAPLDTTKFTVENTDRFVALDAATEAAVSCTGLQERSLADGRLQVVANLRNSGADPFNVQVQCVFMDSQGLPIGPADWQAVAIPAGATEVVHFTAQTTATMKYSIRVRRAR